MGKNVGALVAVILMVITASADENIVAVVNGAPSTEREVSEVVNQMIPRSTFHGSVTGERMIEFREKALQDLITYELQYQDGIARGFTPEKSQVKEQMKLVRESFASSRDYNNWLKQSSLTEDQLREKLRKGLAVKAVMNKTVVEPSSMRRRAR